MNSYTRQIADFAAHIRLADVPKEVIEKAKNIILDGLGCGLYASDVAWTRILAGVVKRLEPKGGQATIWGRGQTASAVNAALVNGTMVQGYELDDTHLGGSIHSGAIVLPAALAIAEHIGAEKVSGEQLLLAIIAGFEIGPRVGMCMSGEQMIIKGWHAPAVSAPFPAAVTSGILLGLTAEQFFHALGIAGTQAGGLMAAQFGSMVKRMQCAKGSQSGMYGALLAADGFTGIENIFEEKYGGYCSTFTHSTDKYDLSALVKGLGKEWETMRIAIKTYACRGGNQTAVNAIDELMRETGLKAEEVDEVTIKVTEGMVKHSGWWPYVPKGLTAAQMHVGFCVAMRLIEGDVFVDQMVEENIARPDLVELTNRVKVVRSVEREARGGEFRKGTDLEVKLRNGQILKKSVDFPLGSEQRPLTKEQMVAKFRRLASKALPRRRVSVVEKAVWDLENAPSVKPLIRALRGKAV